MKALAFLVIFAGILMGSMSAASAQQTSSETTAAVPSAEAVGGAMLTPEQIENLNAMVAQMQTSMNDMVQAARDAALQIGADTKTVVLTTNDLAAIAIGSVGGALVVDLLGGGGMATLAGAVLGGVGTHWLITREGPLFPMAM
ncbi:MAG: hypothetical protein P1U88_06180 [Thalassobaculaceae bacterium]|nr:hypothetical protein [Thalassobaculaceae bacterium]